MLRAILIISYFLFLSIDCCHAEAAALQGKEAFEQEIIRDFSKEIGSENVIQENKPKKGIEGIKGKRSPDLLTIDNGLCTMWETKSPAEAKGKSWFANPRNDYIATCRNKYAAERESVRTNPTLSQQAKKAKIDCLAWTIVIGCQMRHYADNYKSEWHLPAVKSNACNTINRIGLIAPIGNEISKKLRLYDNVEAIKCALETLGIKGEVKPKGNRIYTTFDSVQYKIPFGKPSNQTASEKAANKDVTPEKEHHKSGSQAESAAAKGESPGKSKLEPGPINASEATTSSKSPGLFSSLKEKVLDLYTSTRNKIVTFIDDASKVCADFYRNVSHKISTFVRSIAEKVSNLYHAIVEHLTKLKDKATPSPSTDKAPASIPSSDSLTSQSQPHSEAKPDSRAPSKQPSIAPANTIAKPSPAWHSTFGKIFNGIMKASVAFSIVFSGYTMTKEVYEKAMQGITVHPSRVLARGIVGFAGALAGGIAIGALCTLITIGTAWGAVILGALGTFVGTVAGGIGAEWLYEWIVPMDGFGWAIGDFLLGGLLGSILGAFPGMIGGLIVARVRNALTPAPKMLPKEKKLRKKIMNACVNGCRKVKHWADKKARKRRYATCGLCLGFVFGGFFMATTFLYLFN